ncbi:Plasma membrane t-SNARE, secretory vesicle fusion [Entophlyctis luteolus]|nr:Plasma membrane t-SNARE, secretory vesicle fusion [Entophlyctis luteolus]KAJ3357387.1 Plasma membrane t-SNARE, secretory vesicle fusion [Entophlyctis luteolus]KAJ3394903.1 Plasma membrane t-SNARE, secretory vesicle fusion [Entophlyctis sp. JEL0112]
MSRNQDQRYPPPPQGYGPSGGGGRRPNNYDDRDRYRDDYRDRSASRDAGGGAGPIRERGQSRHRGPAPVGQNRSASTEPLTASAQTFSSGRDRGAEIRNYSPQATYARSGSGGGSGGSANGRGGYNDSGPRAIGGSGTGSFFDSIQAIRADLDTLQQRRIPDLTAVQQRIIASTQPAEQQRLTAQVDKLQDAISAGLQNARKATRKLNADVANDAARLQPAEVHSRKGQLGTLAKKIMAVADDFQAAQRAFKSKYKARMEREIRIARPDATPQEIARALDSSSGAAFSQQLLASRNEKQRRALEEVQDRHTELQKIERSMSELFDLFQEMNAMIEQQQTLINNVEANVENAVEYLDSGSKELSKAIVYRKSTRKKQVWIVAIVIAVLIVVGVVVYIEVMNANELIVGKLKFFPANLFQQVIKPLINK